MRTDPIRPNFYRGAGGYAWQLAEYLQSGQIGYNANAPLDKSLPPKLRNPLATCPEFLSQDCSVRWSSSANMTPNTPRLVGARGTRSSLVVVARSQAFGEFHHEDAQMLAEGTTVGALQGMEFNGVKHDTGTLLVALYRHGFVEIDQIFPHSLPASYLIEPTCIVVDSPCVGQVAINQLNGRTIRLSETSQRIFSQDTCLDEISESLSPNIIHLVEAGMLRLISGGSIRAYD